MPSKPSLHRRATASRTSRPVRRPKPSPSNERWNVTASSAHDTDRLGQAIGQGLRGGETLALFGPLGAGKTALVRGIAQGLGAAPASVSSPTFVLIHEYRGRLPLAHVDLYRLNSARELESTGLTDYLNGSTVTAIEWADKGLALLPEDRLEIELRHRTVGSRTIRLRATGPNSALLLAKARTRFVGSDPALSARRGRPKPKKATS